MRFKISSTIALGVALAIAVDASIAGAQDTTRTRRRSDVRIPVSKEPAQPAPCVCDTVRITRVDTVTQWRRDTVTVTREVAAPAPIVPVPVARTWGRGFYMGLGGGVSMPNRDYRNYDNGYNVTGMIGVDPVSYPLGWRLDLSYDRWSERDVTDQLAPSPTHVTANLDLKLRIPVFGRVAVYALGGGTAAFSKDLLVGPRYQGTTVLTTANQATLAPSIQLEDGWHTNFGFNGGGGVSFGLGRTVDLFIESRLIADKTDTDKSSVPIIAGFTWSF